MEDADRVVEHQAGLSAERAAEIAAEVEGLMGGLARVVDTIGFFDDPDGLQAVLWELREGAPR